ncbi:MAG: polysaccharide biosynthesis/export family protein [Planctomycetaceae bacterium]|nr:polysaccharide biosynthesis/export family protein [Planctomycetales bacterium]MCB9925037.1 polysaccharide biosynthesis/export family protein [Planctomycetaceae bacterium]
MKIRVVATVGIVAICAAGFVAKQRTAMKDAGVSATPSSALRQLDKPALHQKQPEVVELTRFDGSTQSVQLCQANGGMMLGVECNGCGSTCQEAHWAATRPIPWEVFAQGDYVGPARVQHVPEYALRVNDVVEVVYWFTLEARDEAYRLEVGDEVMVESFSDPSLNRGSLDLGRGLMVQPDGTITTRLLGQVPAAGRTIDELRELLEERYLEFYKVPSITVTPLKTNARLEALRSAIDARFGQGGQLRRVTVTPEGTIQLPGIGSMQANGLSIDEVEREVEERYVHEVGPGVNVTVSLFQRAPTFVYVIGEVANPGQFPLQAPTTPIQALSLAGSWNNGANLREIVVLRRTGDWKLMATKLDLRGALLGKRPCPADEIWLRDADIVIVPKSPILLMDDFINLTFTRGLYGVVPFQGMSINFSKLGSI